MMVERTSTYSLQNTTLSSSRRLQAELQKAQTELSTGRHADVGLELGAQVGRNLLWRNKLSQMEATLTRNEVLSNRAQASQAAIDAIKTAASNLSEAAIGARSATNGANLSMTAGGNALQDVMEIMSTNYAGEYVFSGSTPDVAPLQGYEGKPAQAAFDAAFAAEFGFAKDSPLAAGITPSQMQTFLNGRFEDLFKEPSWKVNWSQSADSNLMARISGNTVVDVNANANNEAFKSVLKGAVALYELGGTSIGQGTLQTAIDKAVGYVSDGQAKLSDLQGAIGQGQQAINRVTEKMKIEKGIVETAITSTEGVSDTESAAHVNSLMTQLESSYAVTARISRLSLMNYL